MTIAEKMTLALGLLYAVMLASLIYRHRMGDSPINLDDLLLGEDGKTSKSATILFGAFGLSSWVVAYLVLTDKLTEVVFAGYLAAWVTPTIAHMFKPKPPEPPA